MQHAWKKADGKREQQSSQDEHHGGISSSFFESWLDSIEEKAQMKPDIPSAFSVQAEPKTWPLLQVTLELCPPNIM